MACIDYHVCPKKFWIPKYDKTTLMRIQFIFSQTSPTPYQIRKSLGPVVSEALFHSLPSELKEFLGLQPYLFGPFNQSLWCPPEKQLEGRQVLEVPPTEDILQRLSHITVLNFGFGVEKSLANVDENEYLELEKEIHEFADDILLKLEVELKYKLSHKYQKQLERIKAIYETEMMKEFEGFWEEEKVSVEAKASRCFKGMAQRLREALMVELKTINRNAEEMHKQKYELLNEKIANEAYEEYCRKKSFIKKKMARFWKTVSASQKLERAKIEKMCEARAQARLERELDKELEFGRRLVEKVVDHYQKEFRERVNISEESRLGMLRALKKGEEAALDCFKWKNLVEEILHQLQLFMEYTATLSSEHKTYGVNLRDMIKYRIECLTEDKNTWNHVAKWESDQSSPPDSIRPEDEIFLKSVSQLGDKTGSVLSPKELEEVAEGGKTWEALSLINTVINRAIGEGSYLGQVTAQMECSQEELNTLESKEKVYHIRGRTVSEPKEREKSKEHIRIVGEDKSIGSYDPATFMSSRSLSLINILETHPEIKKFFK